jgi:transcriptional regulator with XRE-family HTH domain
VPSGPPTREPQRGLAKAVRTLRDRAGLSPGEVAERAGISVSVLSWIESGADDPTWGDIRLVARKLGVSMEVLAEAAEENEQGVDPD